MDQRVVARLSMPAFVATFVGLFLISPPVRAQQLKATLPVGSWGQTLAVNPLTHKIYTVDEPVNQVTEIDLTSLETFVIPLGPTPEKSLNAAIRIDASANKLYVLNVASSSIAVIDVATRAVAFVPAGKHPSALEINLRTKKIYVANFDSDTVTVIDARTLSTTTIGVGTHPSHISINSRTNTIYVTNSNSDNVSVIDGKTGRVTTIPTGEYPSGIAVNDRKNTAYVANIMGSSITVIHGRSCETKRIPVSPNPAWVAINENTNKIYVAHQTFNDVTVINGRGNTVSTVGAFINTTGRPYAIAVDPLRNKIFAADWLSGIVIIDDATKAVTRVPNPSNRTHLVVLNPLANEFYTLNFSASVDAKVPSSVSIFTAPETKPERSRARARYPEQIAQISAVFPVF